MKAVRYHSLFQEGNLIELVRTETDYTLDVGDTYSGLTDSEGNRVAYTLSVGALTDGSATLTFTKAA